MRKAFLFTLVFSALLISSAYGQCSSGLQLNHSSLTRGQDIYPTPDSGAIVVGHKGDLTLLKLDKEGNTDWIRDYSGTITNLQPDWTDVVAHPSGKYFVTGQDTAWYNYRAMIMRTSPTGEVEWAKTFGILVDSVKPYLFGDLILADNGDLVAACRFAEYPGLMRLDTSGNVVKTTINRGPFGTVTLTRQHLIQTRDGGFALLFNQGNQVFVCRYDANLDLLWTRFLIGNRRAGGLVELPGGGLVISGTGNPGFWAFQLSPSGSFVWGKQFTHTGNPKGGEVLFTRDGNLVFSGNISGFGAGNAALLIKTDTTGNVLWGKAYNNTGGNEAYALAPSVEAGFYLTGNEGQLTNPLGGVIIKADYRGKTGNACEYDVSNLNDTLHFVFSNTTVDSTDSIIEIYAYVQPWDTILGISDRTCLPTPLDSLPQVNFYGDTAICPGDTLELDASITSPGATYFWNNGDTVNLRNVTTPGYYAVIVTDSAGCSIYEDINVQVFPVPNVTLRNDTTICDDESLVLDAGNPTASFLWSTGDTTQTITVDTTGSYSVIMADTNTCVDIDTFNLQVDSLPTVNIGPDDTICNTLTYFLNANYPGATSYLWNTGQTAQNIFVNYPDTFWVEVTIANGCSSRDSLVLSNYPLPYVNFASDTTICEGDTLILDATNAGATYTWSTGDTVGVISVTDTGTYSVDIVDTNGCQANESVDVFKNQNPVANLGNDTVICANGTYLLDLGLPAGYSYLWSDSSTTRTLLADTAGIYSVTVSDTAGCSGSDTILLTETLPPAVNIGSDTTVCPGLGYTLNAGFPGSTYVWSDSSTGQTLRPISPGSYWVEVTDSFGCQGSDTMNIVFLPGPLVLLGPDTALCAGDSLTLDATNPNVTYLWSTGSTDSTITVDTTGFYSVQVADTGSCPDTDTIHVIFEPLPAVNLGSDTAVCQGAALVLDAGFPGHTYQWSTGALSQTISTGTPGIYWVEVTSPLGCVGQDSITLSRDTLVDALFTYSGGLNMSFTDLSSFGPQTWNWDFGDGSTSNLQNPTHTYAMGNYNVCLTVSDNCGSDTYCQQIVLTGISQGIAGGIELYPNPASQSATLRIPAGISHTLNISLLDMRGKIVLDKTWEPSGTQEFNIPLDNLAEGMYQVVVETTLWREIKKLVITR